MNYKRIYDQIVERAKNRTLVEGYTERHHIIPKCMGGSDDQDNLVTLTAREHFICHWLLAREYKTKELQSAFYFMTQAKRKYQYRYTPSSRAVEEAKTVFIEEISPKLTRWPKGKKRDKEFGENIRQRHLRTGLKPPSRLGCKHTQEAKDKIPQSQIGTSHKKETVEKMKKTALSRLRVKCPYCKESFTKQNIERHSIKCKKQLEK